MVVVPGLVDRLVCLEHLRRRPTEGRVGVAKSARCPVTGGRICRLGECRHYQGGVCAHPDAWRSRPRRHPPVTDLARPAALYGTHWPPCGLQQPADAAPTLPEVCRTWNSISISSSMSACVLVDPTAASMRSRCATSGRT